jgi:hypothetical protein
MRVRGAVGVRVASGVIVGVIALHAGSVDMLVGMGRPISVGVLVLVIDVVVGVLGHRTSSLVSSSRGRIGDLSDCGGLRAVRAAPEDRQLAVADLEAGRRLKSPTDVAERLIVDVGHGAARLAHEMMVPMLVRGLEERAPSAQVSTKDETFVHERIECAVDGRGVDLREARANPRGKVFGREMHVGRSCQGIPDRRTLNRDSLATLA